MFGVQMRWAVAATSVLALAIGPAATKVVPTANGDEPRMTHVALISDHSFSELSGGTGSISRSRLDSMAANGTINMSNGGAVTMTATPVGYKLLHPGYRRTDYRYDADWMYGDDLSCALTCVVRAETQMTFQEFLQGRASKYWTMKLFGRETANPARLTWTYHATYSCGVNVKNADDHLCGNGASPSNQQWQYNNGDEHGEYFEKVNGNIVFPMVALSTHFSDGLTATVKFRGCDVYNRATTTVLVPLSQSGTGD